MSRPGEELGRRDKEATMEVLKLFNLGLTDKRTHNKLIIRVWAANEEDARVVYAVGGLSAEYELRYVREDTYFTKEAKTCG